MGGVMANAAFLVAWQRARDTSDADLRDALRDAIERHEAYVTDLWEGYLALDKDRAEQEAKAPRFLSTDPHDASAVVECIKDTLDEARGDDAEKAIVRLAREWRSGRVINDHEQAIDALEMTLDDQRTKISDLERESRSKLTEDQHAALDRVTRAMGVALTSLQDAMKSLDGLADELKDGQTMTKLRRSRIRQRVLGAGIGVSEAFAALKGDRHG
jgi:hypothetical protein